MQDLCKLLGVRNSGCREQVLEVIAELPRNKPMLRDIFLYKVRRDHGVPNNRVRFCVSGLLPNLRKNRLILGCPEGDVIDSGVLVIKAALQFKMGDPLTLNELAAMWGVPFNTPGKGREYFADGVLKIEQA